MADTLCRGVYVYLFFASFVCVIAVLLVNSTCSCGSMFCGISSWYLHRILSIYAQCTEVLVYSVVISQHICIERYCQFQIMIVYLLKR